MVTVPSGGSTFRVQMRGANVCEWSCHRNCPTQLSQRISCALFHQHLEKCRCSWGMSTGSILCSGNSIWLQQIGAPICMFYLCGACQQWETIFRPAKQRCNPWCKPPLFGFCTQRMANDQSLCSCLQVLMQLTDSSVQEVFGDFYNDLWEGVWHQLSSRRLTVRASASSVETHSQWVEHCPYCSLLN